jgi:hypothetical protein
MEHPTGEAKEVALGLAFDRRLKLEFHGSKITSDAGLLAYRELDHALGLSDIAGKVLTDTRMGANGRHALLGQFRQSVFGRLCASRAMSGRDRRSGERRSRDMCESVAVPGRLPGCLRGRT